MKTVIFDSGYAFLEVEVPDDYHYQNRSEQSNYYEPIDCLNCGKSFKPQNLNIQNCSRHCGAQSAAKTRSRKK